MTADQAQGVLPLPWFVGIIAAELAVVLLTLAARAGTRKIRAARAARCRAIDYDRAVRQALALTRPAPPAQDRWTGLDELQLRREAHKHH